MIEQIISSCSFFDLLSKKLPLFDSVKAVEKIEISKIQRDYVQGSQTINKLTKKEELNPKGAKFLDVLFNKLTSNNDVELQMDFIYGSVLSDGDGNNTFTPLDGQQRLTTLFLLYWYISKRENKWDCNNIGKLLSKFTYETKVTSREFCRHLCEDSFFDLNCGKKPSELIRDCNWYFCSFDNDPTIKAMTNMLDEIHIHYEKYSCRDLFSKLERLKFYILPLNHFKLSEELYVKMNARGKQLSDFENFKADLVRWMKDTDNPIAEKMTALKGDRPYYLQISSQMDNVWSEYVWDHYKDKNPDCLIYKAICRLLLNEYTLQWQDTNDSLSKDNTFILLEKEGDYSSFQAFQRAFECNSDTICKLERFMNTFCTIQDIDKMIQPSWSDNGEFNPFAEKIGNRERAVLCAIQLYLDNVKFEKDKFVQWMRIVWNVAENTDITDSTAMIGLIKNTFAEMANGAEDIILHLTLNEHKTVAVRKEAKKAQFIKKDPEWEELFVNAEKHPYFHGSIDFLIDDFMTKDCFIHRLDMANLLFDDKGFSYDISIGKHIILRAVISNLKSFSSLVGMNEWSGKNYPDKEESEHYLKKHLSSEVELTFIESIRRYCDCQDRDSLLCMLQNECDRNSIIYQDEITAASQLSGDEKAQAIKTAEIHRRTHEALYKYEELQEALQNAKAWRIHREWNSGRYFASKPKSWYEWVVLDADRSEWMSSFFALNNYAIKGEIPCGSTRFFWRKQVICEGIAEYDTGEKMPTQIIIDADGSIRVKNMVRQIDIPDIFAGVDYHETSKDYMITILTDKLINNQLPLPN